MPPHTHPQWLTYPSLPLAVYREIAAHLQQVEGVQVEVLPQDAPSFDYGQSQVKGLSLGYSESLTDAQRQQVQSILDYYAKIHGNYEIKF